MSMIANLQIAAYRRIGLEPPTFDLNEWSGRRDANRRVLSPGGLFERELIERGLDSETARIITARQHVHNEWLKYERIQHAVDTYNPTTPYENPLFWMLLNESKGDLLKLTVNDDDMDLVFRQAIIGSTLCTLPMGSFNGKSFCDITTGTPIVAIDPYVLRVIDIISTPIAYALVQMIHGADIKLIDKLVPVWRESVRVVAMCILENNLGGMQLWSNPQVSKPMKNQLCYIALGFVLMHEYAHVAKGHHLTKAGIKEELEADAHALRYVWRLSDGTESPSWNYAGVEFAYFLCAIYASAQSYCSGSSAHRTLPWEQAATAGNMTDAICTRFQRYVDLAMSRHLDLHEHMLAAMNVMRKVLEQFWGEWLAVIGKYERDQRTIGNATKTSYYLSCS